MVEILGGNTTKVQEGLSPRKGRSRSMQGRLGARASRPLRAPGGRSNGLRLLARARRLGYQINFNPILISRPVPSTSV